MIEFGNTSLAPSSHFVSCKNGESQSLSQSTSVLIDVWKTNQVVSTYLHCSFTAFACRFSYCQECLMDVHKPS